jgi:hypothetical protein
MVPNFKKRKIDSNKLRLAFGINGSIYPSDESAPAPKRRRTGRRNDKLLSIFNAPLFFPSTNSIETTTPRSTYSSDESAPAPARRRTGRRNDKLLSFFNAPLFFPSTNSIEKTSTTSPPTSRSTYPSYESAPAPARRRTGRRNDKLLSFFNAPLFFPSSNSIEETTTTTTTTPRPKRRTITRKDMAICSKPDNYLLQWTMALVHNAGKLKFGAEKKGKKGKSVFEQLDTLELAANGPREHI